MITYKIGDVDCKLGFEDFLSLIHNDKKLYKSDFKNVAELYEFIDKNLKNISELLFDNYTYILEDGLLHNLYGPATIKFLPPESYLPGGPSKRFYIYGKLISIQGDRPCNKIEDFEKQEIFYYQELTGKISTPGNRRREGVDYIKHYYDLRLLRFKDQRKQKLIRLRNANK